MPFAPGPGAAIATVYIFISMPLLLLQLATLPLFIIHKNYREKTCFRILFTNGITDCIQLSTMAVFAIINLYVEEMSQTLQKIGAAIMLQIFCLVVFQHFLLALNRLVVILRPRNLGRKFPLSEEMEAHLFNAMHLIIWLLYLLNMAAFLSPYCGGLFDREKSSFYYDLSLPYTAVYHDIAFYIINILPAICFAIYIWIIWMAKQSRRRMQKGQSAEAALSPYEFNLLLQSIILYTIMTVLILEWKLLGGVSIVWQAALIETPYWLFCGLNPFLYLAMNKEFRRRFCVLYHIG